MNVSNFLGFKMDYCVYVIPFLASVICYINSLGGQFVHDDIPAILHNMDLRPENSILDIFKHDYWGKPMWDNTSHKSYRPLTVLTFRFNYIIHGVNPLGYHIVNLVTHTIVTSLFTHVCFIHIFKTLQPAMLAGLIFAVHPIHTEVVSNIVSRAEILSGLFFLFSYTCFIWGFKTKQHTLSMTKCVFLAVIAMLCKEQGITVLGVCWAQCVISMLYKPTSKMKTQYHQQKAAALLTTSIIAIIGTRLALQQGNLPEFQKEDNPASFEENKFSRWLTYWYIYARNAGLLFWPHPLSHDWQFGTIPLIKRFTDTRNLYTTIFVGTLGARCLRAVYKKSDAVGRIGLLFLIIPFLPSSNVFFRVGFVLAERTLYIPSMGYSILLVQGIQYISTKFGGKKFTSLIFIMLLSFATRTVVRNNVWQTRETLAWSGFETFPQNAKMQFNFANVLREHGLHRKAQIHYEEAIGLWPDYASAHNNLATLLLSENTSIAKHHFKEAIRLAPNHANAHFNLGTQLWLEGDYKSAVIYLVKTLTLDPSCAQCHVNLASVYCDMNSLNKAIVHFDKALNMVTDIPMVAKRYVTCLENLDNSTRTKYSSKPNHRYHNMREIKTGSIVTLTNNNNGTLNHKWTENQKTTHLNHESHLNEQNASDKISSNTDIFQKHIKKFQPNITIKLAILLAKNGNHLQAATLLEDVVNEVPENSTKAEIYYLLGECYKDTGKITPAIIAFQNTLMLSSKHAGAHHNLAVAYHVQKDVTNARFHYNAAIQLEPTNDLLWQNYRKLLALESIH